LRILALSDWEMARGSHSIWGLINSDPGVTGGSPMSKNLPDGQEDPIAEIDEEISEPPMYKVLLHNDDFTTKAFVVAVLRGVFNKSQDEATHLMWHIHKNRIGVCGIYPQEVAETKIAQVTALAKENGFPLKTTMEAE
jgi:ATP-dependent Clp protease adaptor protein ClpS